MADHIVPCPHCGRSLVIVQPSMVIGARSFDGRGRPQRVSFSSVGATGRQVGRFEQSVASLAPWAGSPAGHVPSIDDGAMSPGESRTAKTYRQRSKEDVSVPLLANLVSSGLVGASVLFVSVTLRVADWTIRPFWLNRCQWWIGRHWYLVTPAAFLATMAGLWFKRQLPDLLDDDKLIVSVQEQERRPEPAPINVQPPAVNLEFNERNERGRVERQVRATLSAPASNHDGLWRYCKALAAGQAFPSLEGGKSGPGAAKFGYSSNEFDAWRKEAQRAGLLEAPRAQRQPWTITDRGYGAFARIGQQKQQEASYVVG